MSHDTKASSCGCSHLSFHAPLVSKAPIFVFLHLPPLRICDHSRDDGDAGLQRFFFPSATVERMFGKEGSKRILMTHQRQAAETGSDFNSHGARVLSAPHEASVPLG